MITNNFIELTNGDIINVENIIYIHPSKTKESAFMYLHGLRHSIIDDKHLNSAKMIEISIDDYIMIRAILKPMTQA